MARTITVHKYFKPSLGKYVNQDGYDRKVKDAPVRKKYKKSNIATDRRFSLKKFPVRSDIRQTGKYAGESESVAKLHEQEVKYEKPDLGANRWTMWAWDNGAWQERFTQTRDDRPKDSETIKWLPYGENPNRRIIFNNPDGSIGRAEEIYKGITIDVSHFSQQGYPGSNQVSIYGLKNYGGWLLGTPKNFKTKQEVEDFIKEAKQMIDKKQYGRKTAFMP